MWLVVFGSIAYITHEVPLNASIKTFNLEQARDPATVFDINHLAPKEWLLEVSVGIKKVMKTIADSVRNIQPFELQLDSFSLPFGSLKVDHHQQMDERCQRIRELLKQVLQERNVASRFQDSSSEQELLNLISLGWLPEEESDPSIFELEEAENSAVLKEPYLSQNWEVPGILSLPNSPASSQCSCSQDSLILHNQGSTQVSANNDSETQKVYPAYVMQDQAYQENHPKAEQCESVTVLVEITNKKNDTKTFLSEASLGAIKSCPPDYFDTDFMFNDFCSSLPPMSGTRLWQHSPYSMAYKAIIPAGLNAADRIIVINYNVANPLEVRSSRNFQNPNIKLGGVLMELPPFSIATLIKFITGVEVCSIDMFLKNQGRCSITLHNPNIESLLIFQLLHKRLWLGPTHALYALSEDASRILEEYAKKARKKMPASKKFPCHLITVEYWLAKNQYLHEKHKKAMDRAEILEAVATTADTMVDPLKRAPVWYDAAREAEYVESLEWELNRKGSKEMNFIEAQAYEATRANDGWRLPTIMELEALYLQKSVLGIDLSNDWFWSSTPVPGYDGEYFGLDFDRGSVYHNDDYHGVKVRLVRNKRR